MKIKCLGCGKLRSFKKLNEHPRTYQKRRPLCISCGHKKRVVAIGGHAANWKGGRVINFHGYVLLWLPGVGYRLEHRVIWERHHGKIPRGFVIHHIDGDKENNSIENLQCLSKEEHDRMNDSLRKNHWNNRLKIKQNLCAV